MTVRGRTAIRLAALVAVPALASGCSDRPVDRLNDRLAEREAAVRSCAATRCVDEIAVLVTALGRVPGVVAVTTATYQPEQVTDGASVTGALVVADDVDCHDLEEQAAELGWQSSVSPLMSLDFDCSTLAGGGRPGYLHTLVRPTSPAQLDDWGDRGTLSATG
ncbi:hypothetical protein [Nocardioides daeguensis]|uniref:Lipoprotein n=1 Tax=Nocardioides daeguensis TaxID=908359 RepID=A0ABP6VE36_9ACTN|nr:hypothetical protein [Nocardioides daeguensis]MBV6729536.1 hypothetical protein [Nocardioides daeguensis]MCR1771691.1 hypothetical protein [Nocardioides daeguensis]